MKSLLFWLNLPTILNNYQIEDKYGQTLFEIKKDILGKISVRDQNNKVVKEISKDIFNNIIYQDRVCNKHNIDAYLIDFAIQQIGI